jgi:signal transduction histidine kinase
VGLGLPLALAAAEAHGGTIEVDEPLGGGARFRIVLPAGVE